MNGSRLESHTTPKELYHATQAYIAAAKFAMSVQPNFVPTMDVFLEEITRLNDEIMRLRIEHANKSDVISGQIENLEASILSLTIERNQVAQIAAEAMDERADFYIEKAALQVHKKELQAQVALAKWTAEMYDRIADQSINEQKNGSKAFAEALAAAQELAIENRIDKRKIEVLIQAIKIQACIVELYKAANESTLPKAKVQFSSDAGRLKEMLDEQRYVEAMSLIPDIEVILPNFTSEADEEILPPLDGNDETFAEFMASRVSDVDLSPVISTETQPTNGSEIAIYLEQLNHLFPSLSNINPERLNDLLKIFPAFLEYISKVSKRDINIIDYLMKKLDRLFVDLEYSETMTAEKILQLAEMRIYCEELQAKVDYMTNIISPAELLQTEGQLMIIESPFDRVQQYMIT